MPTITTPADQKISLYRPRTRRRTLIGAGIIAVGLAAGAVVVVPKLPVLLGHYTETGLPTVQGSAGIQPLVDAIAAHREGHGAFPADIVELEHTDGSAFRRDANLMYRVVSNPDRTAYVAGSVGVTGDYSAAIADEDGLVGTGAGATFGEALEESGWTAEWGQAHQFAPLILAEKHYGAMSVSETEVTRLTLDVASGQYTATVTQVPVSGDGDNWQAAVDEAGADPAIFPLDEGSLDDGGPVVVEASDDSATLTALSSGTGVKVRIDYAPRSKATGTVLEPVLEEAGIEPSKLAHVNGAFTCATSTSPDQIDSATLCQGVQGGIWAYATTGAAAADSPTGEEFDELGATESWAQEHDVTLPDYADLF